MIKDITIGQYLYRDSFVHKLDARTKIICSLIYMISIFLVNFLYEYIFVTLFTFIVVYFSKISIKKLLKGLKPILPLLILAPIMNCFGEQSGTIIFKYNFIQITNVGFNQATVMLLRVIFLIFFTSLLSLTTSPISLTNGTESLLIYCKKLNIPAHEISMMMSISLRFIPTLINETDKIMKAQKARGADFETGNIFKRSKSLIPVLVPLFINAFVRADELAMSMESRCYKGDSGRTKFHQLKFKKSDYFVLFLFLFMLILVIYRNII